MAFYKRRRFPLHPGKTLPDGRLWMLLALFSTGGCADVLGIPGDLEPSTTTGQSPGRVILRDGRLSTSPGQPAVVGTLRLSDPAFEQAKRTCTQDKVFCVIGGLTAKGRSEP